MYNVDPMQLIMMIKGSQNPQQLMMGILENQMGNNPMGQNLLNMARNGQTNQIEQFARNLYSSRGLDFDKEFKAFRQQFGL